MSKSKGRNCQIDQMFVIKCTCQKISTQTSTGLSSNQAPGEAPFSTLVHQAAHTFVKYQGGLVPKVYNKIDPSQVSEALFSSSVRLSLPTRPLPKIAALCRSSFPLCGRHLGPSSLNLAPLLPPHLLFTSPASTSPAFHLTCFSLGPRLFSLSYHSLALQCIAGVNKTKADMIFVKNITRPEF